MRKHKTIILYMAGLLLFATTFRISMAEDQEREKKLPHLEETVIVTATRTEISVDMTSKPVTVIDQEAIAARNATNMLTLLEDLVPGISVSSAGASGGQVSLRGLSSNDLKVPLFIDGDRFRGRLQLEYMYLDPARIERIEIIRGPAATIYGTDAMGGLINVITRKAKGERTKAFSLIPRLRSLEYSSAGNLRSGAIEIQGLGKKFDILFGANAKKAENYESPEGEIPGSDIKTMSFDFKFGFEPANGHRIELSAAYNDIMNNGTPGGIGVAPGYPYTYRHIRPMTEKMVKAHYMGNGKILGFSHVEASMYARYLYTELASEIRPRVNPFASVTKVKGIVDGPLGLGGKALGVRLWKGNNSLTVGGDWFRYNQDAVRQEMTKFDAKGNQLAPTVYGTSTPAEVQSNVGLFAQNDWNPSERWTVSAGGRLDYFRTRADVNAIYKGVSKNSDLPITGSLGLVYRPTSIIHFTANAGTSFRAPIPAEKFRTLSGYEPNPDLESENGRTYEAGARLRLKRFNSNLTLFLSDYENLIVRQIVDSSIYPGTKAQKAVNVGKARIEGVEWDATWLAGSNWKIFTNAAYLQGTDASSNIPLSYIAPFNGLIGLRYTPKNQAFYLEAAERWSSRKGRIDASKERETAGYGVLNIYAGLDLNRLSSGFSGMELQFSMDNILDKAYVNPVTPEDITYNRSITNPLLEAGRRVSISLRSKF